MCCIETWQSLVLAFNGETGIAWWCCKYRFLRRHYPEQVRWVGLSSQPLGTPTVRARLSGQRFQRKLNAIWHLGLQGCRFVIYSDQQNASLWLAYKYAVNYALDNSTGGQIGDIVVNDRGEYAIADSAGFFCPGKTFFDALIWHFIEKEYIASNTAERLRRDDDKANWPNTLLAWIS